VRVRFEVMILGLVFLLGGACSHKARDASAQQSATQGASGRTMQLHWDYPREWHRIDVPVTDDNSVEMTFDGRILHLPNALFGDDYPSDVSGPIEQNDLRFAYWYPSLVRAEIGIGWGGSPRPTLPPESQSAVSEPRFPLRVLVEELFYSDDAAPLRLPRPSEYVSSETAIVGGPPTITDTSYPGLRRISWEQSDLKRHPENAESYRGHPNEGQYIQTADSPYELYLSCGRRCDFKLYNTKTHFQADGRISLMDDVVGDSNFSTDPGELTPEVASTILQALNKMLENWASAPSKTSTLSHAAGPVETDICEIRAHPAQYEGREVAVRGRVVVGMQSTNVQDMSCPDEVFVLNIGDDIAKGGDDFAKSRDIRGFVKDVRIHGGRADATLVGIYSSRVPSWPYPFPGLYLHSANRVVYGRN
jgi:hypothetical protein